MFHVASVFLAGEGSEHRWRWPPRAQAVPHVHAQQQARGAAAWARNNMRAAGAQQHVKQQQQVQADRRNSMRGR